MSSADLEARLRGGPTVASDDVAAAVARVLAAPAVLGSAEVVLGWVDTPLGPLTVAVTEVGLVALEFGAADDVAVDVAARVSPRVLVGHTPAVDAARRELDEYFAGRREDFDLPLDWRLVRGAYTRRVLEATARIPFGVVTTYGELSREVGNPRAARATGQALGSNPIPVVVPCHRVLASGGTLGGYTGGLDRKELLLRLEGVIA